MAEENKPETAVVRHELHIVGISLPLGQMIILLFKMCIAFIPVSIVLSVLGIIGYVFMGKMLAIAFP